LGYRLETVAKDSLAIRFLAYITLSSSPNQFTVDWDSVSVASAFRFSISEALLKPAANETFSLKAIPVDYCFVASAVHASVNSSSGIIVSSTTRIFNDSALINTVGNTFQSIDDIVLSAAPGPSNLSSFGRRRLSASHYLLTRRRRLNLQLKPLPPRNLPTFYSLFPASNASVFDVEQVTVNILVPSVEISQALTAILKSERWQFDRLRALTIADSLSASLALSLSSSTGLQLLAFIDESSVETIVLSYKKSYWSFYLGWLQANIYTVLVCTGLLIGFTLCTCSFRGVLFKRKPRVSEEERVARDLYLLEFRASLGASEKRRRTRVAILRWLKEEIIRRSKEKFLSTRTRFLLEKSATGGGFNHHDFYDADPEPEYSAGLIGRKKRFTGARLHSVQSRGVAKSILRDLRGKPQK